MRRWKQPLCVTRRFLVAIANNIGQTRGLVANSVLWMLASNLWWPCFGEIVNTEWNKLQTNTVDKKEKCFVVSICTTLNVTFSFWCMDWISYLNKKEKTCFRSVGNLVVSIEVPKRNFFTWSMIKNVERVLLNSNPAVLDLNYDLNHFSLKEFVLNYVIQIQEVIFCDGLVTYPRVTGELGNLSYQCFIGMVHLTDMEEYIG